MSDMSDIFDVEPCSDLLAAIPHTVFTDDLSSAGRLVLLLAFSLPNKPSKTQLMQLAGICSETTWKKVCRELEQRGWLIRKNHGGAGRGKWRHERTFLRKPLKNLLLD